MNNYNDLWIDNIQTWRKIFWSVPTSQFHVEDSEDIIETETYKMFLAGKNEKDINKLLYNRFRQRMIDIWRKKNKEQEFESLVEELAGEERKEDEYARLEEILAELSENIKETARALATGKKVAEIARELGLNPKTVFEHRNKIKEYFISVRDVYILNF